MSKVLFLSPLSSESSDIINLIHNNVLIALSSMGCTSLVTVPYFSDSIPLNVKAEIDSYNAIPLGAECHRKSGTPTSKWIEYYWKDKYKYLEKLQNVETIVAYLSKNKSTYKTGLQLKYILECKLVVILVDESLPKTYHSDVTYVYIGNRVETFLENKQVLIPWDTHKPYKKGVVADCTKISIVTFWTDYLSELLNSDKLKHVVSSLGSLSKSYFQNHNTNSIYWECFNVKNEEKLKDYVQNNNGFPGFNLNFHKATNMKDIKGRIQAGSIYLNPEMKSQCLDPFALMALQSGVCVVCSSYTILGEMLSKYGYPTVNDNTTSAWLESSQKCMQDRNKLMAAYSSIERDAIQTLDNFTKLVIGKGLSLTCNAAVSRPLTEEQGVEEGTLSVPIQAEDEGFTTFSSATLFRTEVESANFSPVQQSSLYPMNSNPHGYAILINIQTFTSDWQEREGSELDVINLEHLFTQLGFKVQQWIDLTKKDLHHRLHALSQDTDLVEHDAFILVIMSHGAENVIYTHDQQPVEIDSIINYFDNFNCQYLQNKPKLFIIQSCRGKHVDIGVTVADSPQGHPVPYRPGYQPSLPIASDVYVLYACHLGVRAYRDITEGSWIVQEMLSVFREHAHEKHLDELMTEVTRRISLRENRQSEHVEKACPIRVSSLTKQFFFKLALSGQH